MPGGMSFADVLEEKLGDLQPERAARGVQPTYRTLPPNPFLFVEPQRHFRTTAYSAMGRSLGALREVRSVVMPAPVALPQPLRTTRALTVAEDRALAELTGLGATLRRDFTLAELRSAFRTLARQYHPDTHPQSNPAEAARLSRIFADINAHYHCLQAVVDPATSPTS